jgi:hypothetical protein
MSSVGKIFRRLTIKNHYINYEVIEKKKFMEVLPYPPGF